MHWFWSHRFPRVQLWPVSDLFALSTNIEVESVIRPYPIKSFASLVCCSFFPMTINSNVDNPSSYYCKLADYFNFSHGIGSLRSGKKLYPKQNPGNSPGWHKIARLQGYLTKTRSDANVTQWQYRTVAQQTTTNCSRDMTLPAKSQFLPFFPWHLKAYLFCLPFHDIALSQFYVAVVYSGHTVA